MVFQIGFPAGLLAFAILVPLIIVYLRRPKALMRTVPSLMFFAEHRGVLQFASFFRKIMRNLLFLIQLIVLSLLAFSCAQPSVTNENLRFFEHTVLVLDTSASMSGSFDELISQARSGIAAETSIVIATTPIRVAAERVTPDRALMALNTVEPSHRRADLSGGILRAIALADGAPSRIVVITDRRSSISEAVFDLAEKRDQRISIIDVSAPVPYNVGFVDARITAYDVDAAIRNYGPARTVTISGPTASYQVELPADGLRRVSLPLIEGDNRFTIDPPGGFAFDSELFVSNTARSQVSALIVSTSDSTLPVERALRAINRTSIDMSRNRLGTIDQNREYDLIVLSEYSAELILPSFFAEARSFVESGSILVIGKNSRIGQLPQDLLPIEGAGVHEGVYQVSSRGSPLSESVVFSDVIDPLDVRLRNGSLPIAAAGDFPVIAIMPRGAGALIYYGYDDRADFFTQTPYYPIFWSNIVEEITGARSVARVNVQTGDTRSLPASVRIAAPDGSVRIASSVPFDHAGFYRVADVTFAANVLDASESDPRQVLIEQESGPEGSFVRSETQLPITGVLAFIAILLIMLELVILKRRGEL